MGVPAWRWILIKCAAAFELVAEMMKRAAGDFCSGRRPRLLGAWRQSEGRGKRHVVVKGVV